MITSKVTRYNTGERDIAIELIEKLKMMGLKNDLILFDRGYPSKSFIAYLDGVRIVSFVREERFTWLECKWCNN